MGFLRKASREFAGSDRYVADYLMEELWSQLDPAVRRYLLATSILDRLCAPLCQAVMGEETIDSIEGRPVLEWLEEAGLFVVSLDEQREWFRYHHLFRDLLRHRLRTTWPGADVDALHVRAGQWLGAHDFVEDALGHLLEAGMPGLAAGVVEMHRRDAIDRERWQALGRWVGKLGPDLVDARPALVLAHAWLAHQRGDLPDMCRHANHAEHLLDQATEPPGDDEALRGEIAVIRAHASYWEAEGDKALSHARQGLARLPREYRFGRATARVFEGGALHLLGRNEEAFQVLRRGSFGEYGTGVHLRVMSGLAMLAFATGDVDYADHVANLMLSQAADRGLQESAGWAHYFLGLSAYLRNHLSKAEYHFAAVDPYASYVVPAKQSFYGLAWVRQAQGRPDEALEIMDQFTSVISDLNLPLGSEVQLLRARLSTLSGRRTAQAVLARSLLPAAGDGPLQLKMCHELSPLSAIALLLLEWSDNDLSACQAGLRRLLATAEATGSVFRSVQGLILQALLFDRQDSNPEALASLAQAVELARPGHLMRLFPEMGSRVYALLQALRVRGNGDVFLDELISGFVGEELQSRATPPSRPSVPGQEDLIDTLLTNRELDVLELLEQRLSNKEIAKQLVISPATVKRHTLSIYSKLGVGSRQGAVAKARHLGLLPAAH